MFFNNKNAQGFFKLVSNFCSDVAVHVVRDRSIDGRMGMGDGYQVTIKRGGMSFKTRYNNSRYASKNGEKPDLKDILHCLISDHDAYIYTQDYSDFCHEFGYEEYSYGIRKNRQAFCAFNACRKIAEAIEAMFDGLEIAKIAEFCRMSDDDISAALAA